MAEKKGPKQVERSFGFDGCSRERCRSIIVSTSRLISL